MTPEQREEARRRILIVDDDPDGRESLRALLETWGYEVDVAEDGKEGFRLAIERRPDVVLLDIGMPGMSGHDVAQRIRAAQNGQTPS